MRDVAPNDRLAAIVRKAGLSRKALARAVRELSEERGTPISCDHTAVSRWLAGTQPRTQTAQLIADALSASVGGILAVADIGMGESRQASADTESITSTASTITASVEYPDTWSESVDCSLDLWRLDTERREFLISAAFVAGAHATPVLRWLVAGEPDEPVGTGQRLVGMPDVEAVREMTRGFQRIDNKFGGGVARDAVVRYLDREVAPLLRDGRYSASVGRALSGATAELTKLAGWMAHDLDQHGLGQRYLVQSLRLAHAAGDEALGAEILNGMSHQATYLGHGVAGVDLARAARRSAERAGVPALLAEAAVMEAHGHARSGHERQTTLALGEAERIFDQANPADAPQWISYFDEAYLSAKFGHCFRELGRPDPGRKFALRSLNMDGSYVRGMLFNTVLLAALEAQAGEVEQACATGQRALVLADGMKSARIAQYLDRLRDDLAPYSEHPDVRSFNEDARRVARLQLAG